MSVAILLSLIGVSTWRRQVPGCRPFALLMFAVADWALFRAFEEMAGGLEMRLFWVKFQYPGRVTIGPFWLLFALSYSRPDLSPRPGRTSLLFIIPAITTLLVATNEWHHLVIRRVWLTAPADGGSLAFEFGPWQFITLLHSYATLIAGFAFLLYAIVRFPHLYRRQAVPLMIGAVVPWATSILYVGGFSPVKGLDPTPFAFSLTGVIYTFSILRYRLFKVVPVARDLLIERMRDGILVLDGAHHVADINPTASEMLCIKGKSPIGQGALEALGDWPEIMACLGHNFDSQTEVHRPGPPPIYLDVRILPLFEREKRLTGRLIILRDVTLRRQAEYSLRDANELLQAQVAENERLQEELRDQAMRDALTGLPNRRYLIEMLDRAITRAEQESSTLAVIMIDVDYFKRINDQYGHRGGDEVLRALGRLLGMNTRAMDFVCRYGGEEFIAVLPGVNLDTALQRAQKWRAAFEAEVVDSCGSLIRATLSCGVALFPLHGSSGECVLRAADLALYAAKESGRNRVVQARLVSSEVDDPRRS